MSVIMIVPARSFEKQLVMVVRVKGISPYELKDYVRQEAKELPDYQRPIKAMHGGVEIQLHGQSDSGEPIPVNTLGRWVFGVPGYRGHYSQQIIFKQGEDVVAVYCPKEGQALVALALIKLRDKGLVEILGGGEDAEDID